MTSPCPKVRPITSLPAKRPPPANSPQIAAAQRRRGADMSGSELESLEKVLESHLAEPELGEVKRLLFGKDAAWVIARAPDSRDTPSSRCGFVALKFSRPDEKWRALSEHSEMKTSRMTDSLHRHVAALFFFFLVNDCYAGRTLVRAANKWPLTSCFTHTHTLAKYHKTHTGGSVKSYKYRWVNMYYLT